MHPGTVVTSLVAKVGSCRFRTGILDPVGGVQRGTRVRGGDNKRSTETRAMLVSPIFDYSPSQTHVSPLPLVAIFLKKNFIFPLLLSINICVSLAVTGMVVVLFRPQNRNPSVFLDPKPPIPVTLVPRVPEVV